MSKILGFWCWNRLLPLPERGLHQALLGGSPAAAGTLEVGVRISLLTHPHPAFLCSCAFLFLFNLIRPRSFLEFFNFFFPLWGWGVDSFYPIRSV